jgi:hypothetical protein
MPTTFHAWSHNVFRCALSRIWDAAAARDWDRHAREVAALRILGGWYVFHDEPHPGIGDPLL